MLDTANNVFTPIRLDRASWRRPLISIVITHHNYSEFVHDAILSILDQTHENWELVVVDDASSPEHRQRLEDTLSRIRDERIRYLPLAENVGQVLAFFAGFDTTSGDFVCLLDPDDRYAETFLEEAIAVHLNEIVSCPVVSTDQCLLTKNGLLSGGYRADKKLPQYQTKNGVVRLGEQRASTYFIPANLHGWHYASTSAMMFRRAALHYLRPHKLPPFRGEFDTYMGHGAHMLGGTLFYTKPLVYRMLHGSNAWHTSEFYSSFQKRARPDADARGRTARELAREVLLRNNPPSIFTSSRITKVVNKWKRSILKRLPRNSNLQA